MNTNFLEMSVAFIVFCMFFASGPLQDVGVTPVTASNAAYNTVERANTEMARDHKVPIDESCSI
jgi:hypothetical protein